MNNLEKYKVKSTLIRLPVATDELVQQAAKAEGKTKQDYIVDLILKDLVQKKLIKEGE